MCEDIQYYTWFGVFTIKNEKVVDCNLFPKDVHKLAELMEEKTAAFSGSKTCCIDMVNLAIIRVLLIQQRNTTTYCRMLCLKL